MEMNYVRLRELEDHSKKLYKEARQTNHLIIFNDLNVIGEEV